MINVDELIKQCMDSGWFNNEQSARKYVLTYCIPQPEPEYPQEDVFESNNKAEILYGTEGL